MKRMFQTILCTLALAAFAAFAATVGQPAPGFTLKDLSGKPVQLSEFKGRYVVLEWVNPGCPYVQKHYESANMQRLQKELTGKNVAWLAINSTNPRAYDYRTPGEMQKWMKQMNGAPTATLLDENGQVGQAYGAQTTPHMYIIDPNGTLIYAGAIDDKRSTRLEDVKTATNYVRVAMGEALAGKPVSNSSTPPYGCTVKY